MEVWNDIKGYEGLYQISDLGNVKGLKFVKERIMKPVLSKKKYGYYRVSLYKEGKSKLHSIHRLVAHHFIRNENNYPIVMHKDDNRLNNISTNLLWGTNKMNSQQMSKNGRSATNLRKLTDAQVLEIRKKYIPRVVSYAKLAKEYGVHRKTIRFIINRKSWRFI